MKILYIVDSYRPSRSACANRTSVLVSALRDSGHDVRVLASSDSLLDVDDSYVEEDYVTFFKTFPLKEKTLVNRVKNNFGGLLESLKVAKTMGSFDVVICTSPPLLLTVSAMKTAKRLRAKLVLDIRDIWPDVAYEMGSFEPSSLYGKLFSFLAKRGFKKADLITTVSPGKVESLKSKLPEDEKGKVVLVPNGIDENFLAQSFSQRVIDEYDLIARPPVVYIGNLGLAQGISTLLSIAELRPDERFLLFGGGAEEKNLADIVRDRHLANVKLCGRVDAKAAFTLLIHAKFSYVPLKSSKMKDSVPTKLYEALGCGCPVLLAAAGDSVGILEEAGLGVSAAPEDFEGLLAAFDRMASAEWTEEERSRSVAVIRGNYSRQAAAHVMVRLLAPMAKEAEVRGE